METTQLKVNATIVASHRRALNNVGKTFGGMFFRAEQHDTNLRHAQDVIESENNHGLSLVLNRSPRRYKVTGTDIVAIEIGEDAEGASNVYINRGRKRVVGNKEFSQEAVVPISADMRIDSNASDDTILGEALRGDRKKIFADPDMLVEKLNMLNDNEITRIDKIMDELKMWRKVIVDTKNSNINNANRYKAERTAAAEVSVTVTETED